ncbi:probably inactive leucine-rich repeat receptor-like protein kinase At5g48380 [Magnolia sinica]|uniref:probably inactive leucine-rich repeat receptor-like protein kinase At5g48380 n=1 Tax=Magnolia sinica TaxID=86752 RepID=UPI00265AA599|nr:probably inactive leucine-rich repeat receptor-like protein kinase At5g48380 [Magnolia sinica]
MSMAMERRAIFILFHTLLWLFLTTNICNGIEKDIQCLKDIKQSLKDPYNYLTSWNFNNKTKGFICNFNGIECWQPNENMVMNIHLASMSLQGQFPLAFKNCMALTGLDLSNNSLSGPLPHDISEIVPFLRSLNLSSNKISGDIPPSLSYCTYLKTLHLQHNEFTGRIPKQLGNLSFLTSFSVADNLLSGQIPSFLRELPFSSFADNSGLCGKPLGACKDPPKRSHTWIIIIGSLAYRLEKTQNKWLPWRKASEEIDGRREQGDTKASRQVDFISVLLIYI